MLLNIFPQNLAGPWGCFHIFQEQGLRPFYLWRNTGDHQPSGVEALGSFSRWQMKQQGKDRHLLELRAHLFPGRHHVPMQTQYFPASGTYPAATHLNILGILPVYSDLFLVS